MKKLILLSLFLSFSLHAEMRGNVGTGIEGGGGGGGVAEDTVARGAATTALTAATTADAKATTAQTKANTNETNLNAHKILPDSHHKQPRVDPLSDPVLTKNANNEFKININATVFEAPGAEKALGLNKTDTTFSKVLTKLNAFESAGFDNAKYWAKNHTYQANEIFFFEAINGSKDAVGKTLKAPHGYFGRYLTAYTTPANDLDVLETAKIYTVSNGGSLFRDPVADIAALKAVLNPSDGETRQVLAYLPDSVYYTYNTASKTGVTPNSILDVGRWNIPNFSESITNVARGGVASASESYSAGPPINAFDGDLKLKGWGNNQHLPVDLIYDFDKPRDIMGYSFYRNALQTGGWTNVNYSPAEWQTFCKVTGVWEQIESITGQYVLQDAPKAEYLFPEKQCEGIKWHITKSVNGDWVNLTEAEVFSKSSSVPALTENFGDWLGSSSTYATLPAQSAAGVVKKYKDYAHLNTKEIGTGTTENPQYEQGVYFVDDNDTYQFGYRTTGDFTALTDTEILDKTEVKQGISSPKQISTLIQLMIDQKVQFAPSIVAAQSISVRKDAMIYIGNGGGIWRNESGADKNFSSVFGSGFNRKDGTALMLLVDYAVANHALYQQTGNISFKVLDEWYNTKEKPTDAVWTANSVKLKAGEKFVQIRHSDSKRFLYEVKQDWVDGTSTGAVWDVAEEAKFNALSEDTSPSIKHLLAVKEFTGATFPANIDKDDYVFSKDTLTVYKSGGGGLFSTVDRLKYADYMALDIKDGDRYRWMRNYTLPDNSVVNMFVKDNAAGLRGKPIADVAELTALTAKDDELRHELSTKTDYRFKVTARLSAGEIADVLNLADDAGTGKWVRELKSEKLTAEKGSFLVSGGLANAGTTSQVIISIKSGISFKAGGRYEIDVNSAVAAVNGVGRHYYLVLGDGSVITENWKAFSDAEAYTRASGYITTPWHPHIEYEPTADETLNLYIVAQQSTNASDWLKPSQKLDWFINERPQATVTKVDPTLVTVEDIGKALTVLDENPKSDYVWNDNQVKTYNIDTTNAKFLEVTFRETGASKGQFVARVDLSIAPYASLESPYDTWHVRTIVHRKGTTTDISFMDSDVAVQVVMLRAIGYADIKSVIKPSDAVVPSGYNVLLLEGTTDDNDSEIIDFANKIPAGKRVIGLISVLTEFNGGYMTPDKAGIVDLSVLMDTKHSVKLQGKTSHHLNKHYLITLQLADQ